MPRLYYSVLLIAALAVPACRAETAEIARDPSASVARAPAEAPEAGEFPQSPVSTPEPATEIPAGPGVDDVAPAEPAAPAAEEPTAGSTPTAPSPGEAAAASEAEEVLDRVEQAYAQVRSMQADFVQRLSIPLLGTSQTSRGTIYQRKPDRFLMRFSDPEGDVIVADGEYFWMYYPSTDRTQVLRAPMSEGGQRADLQREFLTDASERYVATLIGEEAVGGRPAHVLTLVPKGASPYKLVKVWVDKEDYLVRRFEMTEENDSVRRLELSGLRLNPELPDSLFEFTPPPGAQVFEQ